MTLKSRSMPNFFFQGLSRRTNAADIKSVAGHIKLELQNSETASDVEYRTMWHKLVVK